MKTVKTHCSIFSTLKNQVSSAEITLPVESKTPFSDKLSLKVLFPLCAWFTPPVKIFATFLTKFSLIYQFQTRWAVFVDQGIAPWFTEDLWL